MNQDYLNRMQEYLSIDDYNRLIESYKENPKRSIRLNRISVERLVEYTNMPLEKIEYDIDGYYLNNDEKYGNNVLHHLGAFYFQEPSAMAPVNMYEFKGNERVLDLCAAPGGKSSQIARRIPNGVLYSNELSKKRSQVLFGNLERLGFDNVVVLNERVENLVNKLEGYFDVVLVDAPCSGEGMMRKDEEARNQWNPNLPLQCQKIDFSILEYASKMLKKDGVLIYSTCTFAREEDEDVVDFLCNNLDFEILPPNPCLKKYTMEGFIPNTLRFYPFTGKGEGQFMVLLRKKSAHMEGWRNIKKNKENEEERIIRKFLKENLESYPDFTIKKEGNRFYALTDDVDLTGLTVINYGIELGEVQKGRFIPYHHFFKTLGKYFKNKLVLDVSDSRCLHYIRGEEIQANADNGFGVIEIEGLILGGFKATNGCLKNYYPKGLRNMNLISE